jgi:hypothetical protein
MHPAVVASALTLVFVGYAAAGTVAVVADRDATLIEDPDGALASGAGPSVFAGRNNSADNGVRRALLRFDVSGALAGGGPIVVERVALVLTNLTESNTTPREYRLHRLLADWGEGVSSSTGGGGAPSEAGDATWLHVFHGQSYWMHNGGQFAGEPSARLVVAGPGTYRFESAQLTRDVARWSRKPERNFGWILIGDETGRQNVRAFGSRENPDPAVRPVLEITFGRSGGH